VCLHIGCIQQKPYAVSKTQFINDWRVRRRGGNEFAHALREYTVSSIEQHRSDAHRGRWILLVVALVAVLVVGATVAAGLFRQPATTVEPTAPDDFRIALDQVQTVAGTTLHLTGAEFASDGTLLDFNVSWPGFDPATSLMPITYEALTVSGVSGDPTYFGSSNQEQPRDGAVPVTLAIGPPTPQAADIVVEISKIGLADADGARWIDGPWSFTTRSTFPSRLARRLSRGRSRSRSIPSTCRAGQ